MNQFLKNRIVIYIYHQWRKYLTFAILDNNLASILINLLKQITALELL